MKDTRNVGQKGPAKTNFLLSHLDPARLFTELVERLDGDYTGVATLFALLGQQADLAFVPGSQRELSAALGGRVSPRQVNRALANLQSYGLIEGQTHPNTATLFRVNVPALHALLAEPLPATDFIPGLSPLSALDRLFASESLNREGTPHE